MMKRRTFQEKYDFIIAAHGAQRYGGTKTDDFGMDGSHHYGVHLVEVTDVLRWLGWDADVEILVGCLGHDVVEDTKKTIRDLLAFGFTRREAWIIWACTDGDGATRKERKAFAYIKINGVGVDAKKVKLCDRIANVVHGIRSGNRRKYELYKKEHVEFMAQLRNSFYEPELEIAWIWLDYFFTEEGRLALWETRKCCTF